jgi:hypothetical protein
MRNRKKDCITNVVSEDTNHSVIFTTYAGAATNISLTTSNTDLNGNQLPAITTTENNYLNPVVVGRHTSFSLNVNAATSGVCSLYSKLEKWNGTTWIPPNGTNVCQRNIPVSCTGTSQTIPSQTMGTLTGGVAGYTLGWMENPTNSPDNSIWRLTYGLTNSCGLNTISVVFQVSSGLYKKIPTQQNLVSDNTVNVFPNPVGDMLNINISLAEKQVVSSTIYNYEGKLISKLLQNETKDMGDNVITLPTNSYAKGLYIYEVVIGDNVIRGKFIKQ